MYRKRSAKKSKCLFRTGFGIFTLWLFNHWLPAGIAHQKGAAEICVGDFCLENCDPKMEISKSLDLRNSTVNIGAPPGGERHCFFKLRRPQEIFFVKLVKTNITKSYIQLFWDYLDEKGLGIIFIRFQTPFFRKVGNFYQNLTP